MNAFNYHFPVLLQIDGSSILLVEMNNEHRIVRVRVSKYVSAAVSLIERGNMHMDRAIVTLHFFNLQWINKTVDYTTIVNSFSDI